MYAAIFGYTEEKILILILHIVSEIKKQRSVKRFRKDGLIMSNVYEIITNKILNRIEEAEK